MASDHHPITVETLEQVGARASSTLQQAREKIQRPDQRKYPPRFSTAKLGSIVGLDRSQVQTRLSSGSGELPSGLMLRRRRSFSLEDLQLWARHYRHSFMRPTAVPAFVLALAHFKGGSGKTTSAVSIAHGLSRLGHKGLVIDTDPQGSMTTLFGFLPDVEIKEEQTLTPLFAGPEYDENHQLVAPGPSDVDYAIKSTYWPGIDIIPSASALFSAELHLPSRQIREGTDFQFWRVLDLALDACRERYDFIIIDTPPSLSYITMNALSAADGIIMPLPPNNLDFASSTQFWTMFGELQKGFAARGYEKSWALTEVLLTRMKLTGQSTSVIREWIEFAYGGMLAPVQIPDLEAVRTAAKNFGTVFDLQPVADDDEQPAAPDGDEPATATTTPRTFQAAVDAYERLALHVESRMVTMWRKMGA
jgi:chromosome partitioning protein